MKHFQLWSLFFPITLLLSCNEETKTIAPPVSVQPQTSVAAIKARSGSCIIEDRNGNIWYTTVKTGVYRFDGKTFTNFTKGDGLSSNDVFCIMEDRNGIIWFGTADGVTTYDGNKFDTIPITTITHQKNYRKTEDDAFGVPQPPINYVTAIMQDSKGIIWFGCMSGVFRYDGNKYRELTVDDSVKNNTDVLLGEIYGLGTESFLEDRNGDVWFGGRGIVGLFRCTHDSLINYHVDLDNWVRPLFEDRSGNIWFGSRQKFLYRYDGKDFYQAGQKEIPDWVFYGAQDKNGHLWFLSTEFDGMTYKPAMQRDGFTFTKVWGVMSDHEGNIWFMNRDKHLCKYDGSVFTNYQ